MHVTRFRVHRRRRVLTQPHISDGERPAAFRAPWDKSPPRPATTRQPRAGEPTLPVPITVGGTATTEGIVAIAHRPTEDPTADAATARRLTADRLAGIATQRRRPTVLVPSAAAAITAAPAAGLLTEATDAEINLISTERRLVIRAAFSFGFP